MTAPRPLLFVLWGVLFSLRERERGAGGEAPIGKVRSADFFPLEKGKNERQRTHRSPSFLFSSYNEQEAAASVLELTRRDTHPQVHGAAGGRRQAHTLTHTHAVEHTHPHAHTRGNPGSPHFHTHPPWSWAQPERRFSRTERRLDLPVQHHSCTYKHTPARSNEIRPSPELAPCMHGCLV